MSRVAIEMPTKAELKKVLKSCDTYEEAAEHFEVHVDTLRKWRDEKGLD